MRIYCVAIAILVLTTACSPGFETAGIQTPSRAPAKNPEAENPPALKPATWQKGELIAPGGRNNPYALPLDEFQENVTRGKIHPLVYPVEITGALIPYDSVVAFFDEPSMNPLRAVLQNLSTTFMKMKSFDDVTDWLGLHRYPRDAGTENSNFPLPPGYRSGDPMGLTKIDTGHGIGFTVSCAGCHVGELFGRPILGLTNRFPRANAFFIRGKQLTEVVATPFFQLGTGSTDGEAEIYRRTRYNLRSVDSKAPEVLGLDTSLAHVALSLARRERDEFATKSPNKQYHPDDERLKTFPADSKPAVWWNVKYKNRFLLDGSVVSGNPIVTNILWNEIGRGTDLKELSLWIDRNQSVLRELTTAVFATEAPSISDFFPPERIDLNRAKRGELLFSQHCARCHGTYEKAWSLPDANLLNATELLRTRLVRYSAQTRVIDVGTDSHRAEGMQSLLALNDLAISKKNGVVIEKQRGYVPPPLVGIWARWPYFHNNSAPSLCAVLSPAANRPVTYWAGQPNDRDLDFDFECNGYPTGSATPSQWKSDRAYLYDTRRKGLSNSGHDRGIFIKNGKSVFTKTDRGDLVQFLQTL